MRTTSLKVLAFLVLTVFLGAMVWRLLGGESPEAAHTFRARFTDVSALKSGDEVRVAGVQVGRVQSVDLQKDHTVLVGFTVSDRVTVTDTTRAGIKYKDLTGNRYLSLSRGVAKLEEARPSAGSGARPAAALTAAGNGRGTPLGPDAEIPLARTSGALDLDALFGGFQPLFNALTPDQVNQLSTGLVQILQGEGSNVMAVLRNIADFTATLNTRDAVIGQVITNLNTVLLAMTKDKDAFGDAVDQAQGLISGLAAQRRQIAGGLQATGELTGRLTGTLRTLQPELNTTSDELATMSRLLTVPRTAAGIDRRLTELPKAQRRLAGIGSYGAFANFYVCGLGVNYETATGLAQTPFLTLPDKRCQW